MRSVTAGYFGPRRHEQSVNVKLAVTRYAGYFSPTTGGLLCPIIIHLNHPSTEIKDTVPVKDIPSINDKWNKSFKSNNLDVYSGWTSN